MTAEQALKNLRECVAQVQAAGAVHDVLRESLGVLEKEIHHRGTEGTEKRGKE